MLKEKRMSLASCAFFASSATATATLQPFGASASAIACAAAASAAASAAACAAASAALALGEFCATSAAFSAAARAFFAASSASSPACNDDMAHIRNGCLNNYDVTAFHARERVIRPPHLLRARELFRVCLRLVRGRGRVRRALLGRRERGREHRVAPVALLLALLVRERRAVRRDRVVPGGMTDERREEFQGNERVEERSGVDRGRYTTRDDIMRFRFVSTGAPYAVTVTSRRHIDQKKQRATRAARTRSHDAAG